LRKRERRERERRVTPSRGNGDETVAVAAPGPHLREPALGWDENCMTVMSLSSQRASGVSRRSPSASTASSRRPGCTRWPGRGAIDGRATDACTASTGGCTVGHAADAARGSQTAAAAHAAAPAHGPRRRICRFRRACTPPAPGLARPRGLEGSPRFPRDVEENVPHLQTASPPPGLRTTVLPAMCCSLLRSAAITHLLT
jgi:hypothetical protein